MEQGKCVGWRHFIASGFSKHHARLMFVALALVTIAIGLLVHWRGALLQPTIRDFLGDALWAMMIAWWMGALAPNERLVSRATIALAICVTVEFSQLYHSPMLDSSRLTLPGRLILGTGFDVRDLGAYAVGVFAATILELKLRRRHAGSLPVGSFE